MIQESIKQYIYLMRWHKPIGFLLLLWPTLWALWLAGDGHPGAFVCGIFVAGVFLVRSAGCIINDIADRHYDSHVERTRDRPLASGKLSVRAALVLFCMLMLLAFLLVLNLNGLTVCLAFVGAALAIVYPFMKRVTHLPQVGLGLAFSWGVPMAFAAETGAVPAKAWILFLTAVIWPVIYDTMYAMTDRRDDMQIGIKSTAILFAGYDKLILGILQIVFFVMLFWVGKLFELNEMYFFALIPVAIFFCYEQFLIRHREPALCFKAFLNNNWVGLFVFAGILSGYYL